jgi:hypothetical protein
VLWHLLSSLETRSQKPEATPGVNSALNGNEETFLVWKGVSQTSQWISLTSPKPLDREEAIVVLQWSLVSCVGIFFIDPPSCQNNVLFMTYGLHSLQFYRKWARPNGALKCPTSFRSCQCLFPRPTKREFISFPTYLLLSTNSFMSLSQTTFSSFHLEIQGATMGSSA